MRFVRRTGLLALFVLPATLLLATPAVASTGELAQKADPDGCLQATNSVNTGGCTSSRWLFDARSVTVSPDGTSAYAVSRSGDAISVFDRDPATGKLTQMADPDGCIVDTGYAGCTTGTGLESSRSITVSPDSKSVYVSSYYAIAIFDRDPATGKLTQKLGTAGCITDDNTVAGVTTCADGVGMLYPSSIIVSPDGTSAYVAVSDGVATFNRDTTTGALTQKASPDGCITNVATTGCTTGKALDGPRSVAVSPDGGNVYAAAGPGGGVVIFDRNTTNGKLSQKGGTAGCITNYATTGCTSGKALEFLDWYGSITVSPDGKNAYVASGGSDAVAIFDRDPANGELTQKTGTSGCISEDGTSGACADGTALGIASSVSVSPDGKSTYVASAQGDAVAIFDRDPANGELTQKTGTSGCISEDGTSGNCINGKGLRSPQSVTLSPDGNNVYIASADSAAVAIFDREPAPLRNSAPTIIPATFDGTGAASPFPSTIEVSGFDPKLSDVNVTLYGLSHTWPDDIDIMLAGPTGASTILTSDAGGGTAIAAVDLTFDGEAPGQLDNDGAISTGTYKPTNFDTDNDFNPLPTCNPGPGVPASGTAIPAVGCLAKAFNGTDPNGTWSLYVGDDAALDNGSLAYGWSLEIETDIVVPNVAVNSGPSGLTADNTPTFGFSADESVTFACRIRPQTGPGLFGPCSGPGDSHTPTSPLTDGDYTFDLRATDTAANSGIKSADFTVDTTPPDTVIDSGPTGIITTDEATFTVSADPNVDIARIQCRIDSEPFADCLSPKTFTGLAEGPHTATFRAEDVAGNQDPTPATRTFTVDTTPPVTQIDSGPTGTITTNEATFTFSSSEVGSSFECGIDGSGFSPCSSPQSYPGLSDGPHRFAVRAIDEAGNTDLSQLARTFTVDTTVYRARIGRVQVTGPAKVRNKRAATYTVRVYNSGNALARGVRLQVSGRGVRARRAVGKIPAGRSRIVRLRLRPTRAGRLRLTFRAVSSNAGGRTVRKTIIVRR